MKRSARPGSWQGLEFHLDDEIGDWLSPRLDSSIASDHSSLTEAVNKNETLLVIV